MIDITTLTKEDISKQVIYLPPHIKIPEAGVLSSWNDTYIFVKFLGPNGEACIPEDLNFTFNSEN